MRPLPKILIAPNGARKQKSDHQHIPLTISEIVKTAVDCAAKGAGGIHAHIRDNTGRHLLDAAKYRELVDEITANLPDFYIQVSTELAGRYDASEQFQLLQDLRPHSISLALAEVETNGDDGFTREVYQFLANLKTDVQHIIYSPDELLRFNKLVDKGIIHDTTPKLLFVLGRYAANQQSAPEELDPFLTTLKKTKLQSDWAMCAFGLRETECLAYAMSKGGKARIGFENSFWNSNGEVASSNSERVSDLVQYTKI